uniref:SH2 domain-containing protein n=1 Tax=Panagrellus redivivus TaxID=6233 RepID=A0A7E4VJ11_PANRE
MVRLCFCWPAPASDAVKANSSPPRNNNDDDTYGTIDDRITRPGKPDPVSLRPNPKAITGDRHSTPSTRPSRSDGTPNRKSVSFFPFMKKLKTTPQRELPQVPKKSFSRNVPPIDADPSNPMYECIGDGENDSISDPLYSKVDDQPGPSGTGQRYDYPMFRGNQRKHPPAALKKRNLLSNGVAPIASTSGDEPVYTSASAIYSGGSEDPYSSIVSEAGGRRQGDDNSIYDHGYARVKDPSTVAGPSRRPVVVGARTETDGSGVSNIDQLYAKINRPSMRRVRLAADEPGPSTLPQNPLPSSLPSTVDVNQTNESGSGSVVSGTSTNPSYRYLTVRETVDVVRERIRQRQEAAATAAAEMAPVREHYYSTIANEYESVGGGSIADSIYGTAITGPPVQLPPESVGSPPRMAPLTLNVARLSGIYEQTPPRPPTSPIPSRQPEGMSTSLHGMPIPHLHGPRILTSPTADRAFSSNPNLSLFPRGQPRIISVPISRLSLSFSGATSGGDLHDSTARRSVGVQPASSTRSTNTLVDCETQTNEPSRIPISTARLAAALTHRSRSPTMDSATQTERRRSQLSLNTMGTSTRGMPPPSNPLPSGRDYISPVDLSDKRSCTTV